MMLPFLEQFVLKSRYSENPDRFRAASPITYAHSEAPPFFVLHGEKDELVPSGQARVFCAALRDAGAATVGYAELANAHHAFDITPTVRSRLAAGAVGDFLGVVYGRRAGSLARSLRLSATSAS
jgi:acetyl esterase/lipase